MYNSPYYKVINEYVDYSDDESREYILNLNEAEQNKVLINLTSRLYTHITRRISDIDFGTIPNSKGDITKVENYQQMIDCLDVIKGMLVEYKQKTEPVDIIYEAIENIKNKKDKFELSFKLNAEFPVLIYSTVTLAIISSISFLITTCIEYIKVPDSDDFQITLNTVGLSKTRGNLLFENLKKFNTSIKKGEIDKVLDTINKTGARNILGVDTFFIMNATVVSMIALSIIPLIRELIYFFYYSRVRISDYFDMQADLLKMNIYNIQQKTDDNIDENKKKNIIEKQSKIVSLFKKISNFISISNKTGENKAKNDIKKDESNKLKITYNSIDMDNSDTSLF